ncbi:FISUMP domain-containing protein [Fibrobacter sp. UBA4297]|uniref:FISUMP domain-containing protein n=1 Tax=Fibrobacter sp. UBA4297 TaxID=1946536 RepID=UPI0025BFC4EA|nr:FISUMP domain-containing protein [Fibrobacter sp. UBA4297]
MFSWNKKIFCGCITLSLMLLACSNDDTNAVAPIASPQIESEGGSAQTTMVVNLNCAHVEGRAVSLTRMDNGQKYEFHSYELASKVRMYELDSVTLDTTGTIWRRFVLDTNGNFSFDSVSLKSPYVMIEVEPVEDSYLKINPRLIVDVRKTNSVRVNMLTYLESFRLRHLVQSGMYFDDAQAQAKREVLDAFGLYDESPDFDKKDDERTQEYLNFAGWFFPYILVDSVTVAFGQSGVFRNIDSRSMDALVNWASEEISTSGYGLELPYEYYEAIGWADYYRYSYNHMVLALNFLSALKGFGKCTAEKEGVSYEIHDGYYGIQCDGTQWKILINGFKKVDFTTGTMTDNRDGKTYKTVTYNIGDSTLTVMAENLDYGDNVHKELCIDVNPENPNVSVRNMEGVRSAESSGCGVYGGLYRVIDALALDTTFLVENAFDTCVADYVKYRRWHGEGPVVIDSNQIRETCYYTSVNEQKITAWADSVETANGHVQGICPDGWHIPSAEEWNTLWTHLGSVYLGDSPFWDPSGLALKSIGQVDEPIDFLGKSNIYFATLPESLSEFTVWMWSWAYQVAHHDALSGIGVMISFVRCMKN